jgi:ABC-2 type transport system permease protein
MILTVAKKEFVDAWRDGRFRIGGLFVLVLLLVAGLLASQQVDRAQAEREAATKLERVNWLEQGDKNSHSAGHYGVNVFKPVSPLALFDRGIEPFVGTAIFLEAHRQNQTAFLPAQDATSMRRFGELSAALALQVLVPLLIILLAFGSLAGERERGTLRQALSLGVRPQSLVLGKALGLGLSITALLVLPAIAFGIFVMQVAPEVGAAGVAGGVLSRAGGLFLCYAIYLTVFIAISISVSASSRTASTALTILLAFWALNCVVAPRLASDVVHHFLPTPKLAVFEAEMQKDLQEGLDGHGSRSEQLDAFVVETLQEYGKTSLQELPFNFQGHVMLESERLAGEVFDRHYGKLWDRIEKQDRSVSWTGFAAPMLALRSASMALAGTDFSHHRHFASTAENHRREFVRLLNEDLKNNAAPGDHGYTAGRELWEKLPVFQLEQVPSTSAWSGASSGLLVLGAWLIAAFGFLAFSAGRLRVGDA